MIYVLLATLVLNLGASWYHFFTDSYDKATYFMVVATFILVSMLGTTR